MTSVQLQFHAVGDEMIDLALKWGHEHGLRIAAEHFGPEYRVTTLPLLRVVNASQGPSSIDRLALRQAPLDLSAASAHQFATRNKGCFFVSAEWPTEEGLRESAMGGITDDAELLRTWRRMIRQAETSMHRGARVRSALLGTATAAPAHRHSVGAHELAEQGVKMLPAGGGNEILFDDVVGTQHGNEPIGRFFLVLPEVPGGLGRMTTLDSAVVPPRARRLHYVIDDWLGDPIVESYPSFMVVREAGECLLNAEMTGFELKPATVTRSEESQALDPSLQLPDFMLLDVNGTAMVDDVGVDEMGRLVVSARALFALTEEGMWFAEVTEI